MLRVPRYTQFVKYLFGLLCKLVCSGTLRTTSRRRGLTTRWDQKFFASTRGRIVTLLRCTGRTVEELARALGLTDNGVRSHLAILERDGIVRQHGTVSHDGSGKPAYVYELTPEAEEDLFAKAYRPVLLQLLDAMSERLGSAEAEALLRAVGRRMARERLIRTDGVQARLERAIAVLNELGGFAELEEHGDSFIIRGYSCPLAAVVPDHPEMCRLVETLITELVGVPAHEHCDRGERPRCCFEVTGASKTIRQGSPIKDG